MVIYSSMSFGIALAALFICLGDLMFTLMDGHTGKPQNRLYIAMVSLLAVNAVCEMMNYVYSQDALTSDRAFQIMQVWQYVYFLCHSMISPLFFFYISFVTGRSVQFRLRRQPGISASRHMRTLIAFAVLVGTEAVLALNPLTHWCWTFDENRAFHRAWGEYIFLYGFSAVWMIGAFLLTMRSWTILTKSRKRSLLISFLLPSVGILVQMLNTRFRIEILLEAIGFTSVLLFVENEDDRRNAELDTYNSAAFSLDIAASLKNRIPVHVLILRNVRFNKTANTVVSGIMNRERINSAISEYLGTVVKRHFIYSIGRGRFALTLYDMTDEDAHAVAQKIHARFGQAWFINGADIILTARLMLVKVPDRAKSADEVLYIASCPIPEHMQEPIIEDKALDWIIRRSAVEEAVMHGLENGSFEVFYQPTFNMDKTLHGAEALLRMNDKKMGRIFPDEFIPIAEQLGMIDILDEFVLKEVCRFILTGIPQKNGMDCINVNLSVLECMKDGFAEYISGIVEAAGVRKKLINFEITESVAATDYSHLASVIDQLRHEGFLFSIDDYGTGYSNMTSVFSLGADIIKIDKSILWNAEQSELGMTLLKTSIDMVHKMQKKALMEGVETEAHIAILKELGCDYLQGFYFSKPLPQDEFIALIEKCSAAQAIK